MAEKTPVKWTTRKILERPEFGTPPPKMPTNRIGKRKFVFEDVLDKVREHPGVWAKIATYTKGTRYQTSEQVQADKQRINNYLKRYKPLETWTVSQRTTPDTWYHRELWVRYGGELTPAQAAEKAAKRREFGLALRNKRVKNAMDKAAAKHFDVA